MFLPQVYKSKRKKIFFENEVRNKIFNKSSKNLSFLLHKRFNWMKRYFKKKDQIIIELGSGSGCIKKILNKKKILLTDIIKYPWIDKKIDMTKVNLKNKYKNKVDIFIINHALHHSSNPVNCLKRLHKYLKKDGYILINEPETSFCLKLIQMITSDEGWSYKRNIFEVNRKETSEDKDPWFSNTATAELLFGNKIKFDNYFPEYDICKNELSEFFIFINSGGVNSDIFKIPLNYPALKILDLIDWILIKIFPRIFALNRSIVLKKI